MRYKISHYYGHLPPVPEAVQCDTPWNQVPDYEVEVDDLNEFAERNGNIILSPPSQRPNEGHWHIWVTDRTGRFVQK